MMAEVAVGSVTTNWYALYDPSLLVSHSISYSRIGVSLRGAFQQMTGAAQWAIQIPVISGGSP